LMPNGRVGLGEPCGGRGVAPYRVDLCLVPFPSRVGWSCAVVLCTVVFLLVLDRSARADDGGTVHSHSLRQNDTTLLEIDRERRLRDRFLVTPEEGLGYFEEIERQRHRRHFVGHYRKVALRRVRDWSLDLFAGEWSDGLSFANGHGEAPGEGTWVGRAIDRLVNGTDVELGYGAGDGLSVSFGRDLDWRGPVWLVRSRVEVDPLVGEMTLDFHLRRTSVACAVSRDGDATVSWTLPF